MNGCRATKPVVCCVWKSCVFFVQRGREQKALRALRLVYRLNHLHRGRDCHFPIKSVHVETGGANEGGMAKKMGRLVQFCEQVKQVREMVLIIQLVLVMACIIVSCLEASEPNG